MKCFTFENIHPQHISLPWPMTKYVMANMTYNILEKLNRTCKFFFSQQPVVVVSNLFAEKNTVEILHQKQLKVNDLAIKFWIINEFVCWNSYSLNILLKYIHRFEYQGLCFNKPEMSYSEYLLVTSSKNLKYVRFDEAILMDKFPFVEDMLADLPNIHKFCL